MLVRNVGKESTRNAVGVNRPLGISQNLTPKSADLMTVSNLKNTPGENYKYLFKSIVFIGTSTETNNVF